MEFMPYKTFNNELIFKGEELTLDYASFLDENMEPFDCWSRGANCRGLISGIPNNSITEREK